ncbi:MAG: HEAT repeat domain-containing protein [Myxococcota bacterium]
MSRFAAAALTLLLLHVWTRPALAETPAADLPAAATSTDATPEADRALLQPLLDALGAAPRDRAARVPHLLDSHDLRAVGPLRYAALHDPQDEVVDAAVRALGAIEDATALRALRDVAVGTEGSSPRDLALDMMSRSKLTLGRDLVYEIARSTDHPDEVRRTALEVLTRDHPDFLATKPSLQLGGSALVSTLGGAYFGGFALASVGDLAGSNGAGAIGWVAGSIAGAGAGYIFGRQLSNARQQYYMSAMGWGALSGTLAARALVQPQYITDAWGNRIQQDSPSLQRTDAGLSLVGELGGLALAGLAVDRLNFTSSDVLVADLTGVAMTVGTAGALLLMDPTEDDRPGYGIALAGALMGVGLGVTTAQQLRFDSGDVALTLLGTGEGMYFGSFLADRFVSGRANGGLWLGAGLGALGTGVAAQFTDVTVSNAFEMLLFSSYAKTLGAGAAILADAESDTVTDVHLAVGAVGLLAGGWLSSQTDYQGGDRAIVPIATALGAWHGLLWGGLAHDQRWMTGSGAVPGLALTSMSAFGLGSLALAQATDMSNWQVTMGSSGAVWGAWLAGWGLALSDHMSDSQLASTLIIGTDVGLAATALLISPVGGMDPRVLAGANFGGLTGAAMFSLVGAMFSTNSDTVIQANLAGTAIGLVTGGILAHAVLKDEPPAAADADSPTWLPDWVHNPIKTVQFAPRLDPAGRFDGMTLNAVLDVFDAP